MPENWQPDVNAASARDRQMMFVPGNKELRQREDVSSLYRIPKEKRVEGETAYEQQRGLGEHYGGMFRGRLKVDEAKAGQNNVSDIVEAMEAIDPSSLYTDQSEENKRRIAQRLRMLREFYTGFYTYRDGGKGQPYFHQDEFDLIMDSALAEYSVMQALSEASAKWKLEVYHASEIEDLRHGTDCYLWDPRREKGLAIQTKCLTAKRAPKHLARGLSLDPQSISDRILDNEDYAGINLLKNESYRRKFENRARALLTNCSNYDNLTPVFVLLPKINGEPATFNETTGLPSGRMKDELFSELGFML